jgi:hypothetical protein
MTRLANIEKAGYFPLPSPVRNSSRPTWPPRMGAVFWTRAPVRERPWSTFAEELGLDPYGVELHEGRAAAARHTVSSCWNRGLMPANMEFACCTTATRTSSPRGAVITSSTSTHPTTTMTRTAVWNTSGSSAVVPGCSPAACWSGLCRSICSSSARPPATSSPGTIGCRSTVSR